MTEEQSHQFIHEAELAERYVAGRMGEAERVAFEDHFVTCAECQRDVRFMGAVRAAIVASGATDATPPRVTMPAGGVAAPRRRRAVWAGAAIAGGMAAVAIFALLPSSAVTALGTVDAAPPYLGIAVRGTPGRGEAVFDAAMKDYAAGRYAAATRGLQSALAAGEDSLPTEFFGGASLLFGGDARGAAAAFGRVVARGDSPYRDEAQWYAAKALLRLGESRDALAALRAHTPNDPAVAARLSALADSIRRVTGMK